MRELIQVINKNVKEIPAIEQKEILKFSKRLESYTHVPTNEKEIQRMKSFSHNKYLVAFIQKNLENYSYPKASKYPFDIVSYWYCITLIVLSESTDGRNYVLDVARRFIKNEHLDLWQFRRLLDSIKLEEYQTIKKEIDAYFSLKQNDLESYKWAKQIGLELPKDNSWMFFFEISTDGKFRFGNDLTDLEKEERLRMTISVYPLQGKKCWEIELKNWNNSISAWWPNLTEREIRLSKKKNDYVLKKKPTLSNLKEVIKEVEILFNVRFNKTIYSKRFKGKIKNKNAIQNWLNE